jgi:glucosylceramidase
MHRLGQALTGAAVALAAMSAQAQNRHKVEVWLTSADRTSLLAEQPEKLVFSKKPAAAVTIAVDDEHPMQSVDGYGFALTGGSAQLLMQMDAVHRAALLREMFGTDAKAVGVSYLRVSIGSSDMNAKVFTYDDIPDGETDPQLAHFDLGPDHADVIPVLKEILKINPKIAILGSPWSAPSWMKTNGKPKGGNLKPEDYSVYADYLVRYVQAMGREGIHIDTLTVQNEPLNPKNTPSMVMESKEEGDFIATALGPALAKAGLATRIILYDHNCDRPDYPMDILARPEAARYVAGSGFHLYEGPVSAMSQVHDAYPQKNLYFTEQMIIQPDTQHPLRIAEAVNRTVIGPARNWSRTTLLWNLAADPKFGPHTDNGGCPVCQGAVTLDGNEVTRNLAYYTLAQVSKFVGPGAVRVASDTSNPQSPLGNVAFEKQKHGKVLIVANTGKEPQTFSVSYKGASFEAKLAGGDAATYVWK